MVADVCDLDELETNERREGIFGSVYWWMVELGQSMALAIGGPLLNLTGFDVALGEAQSEDTLFLLRFFDVVVPNDLLWYCDLGDCDIYAHRGKSPSGARETRAQARQCGSRRCVMCELIFDVERVEALIAEMSLDQKIGQMVQAERNTISPDEVKVHHIGSVFERCAVHLRAIIIRKTGSI